MGIINDILKSLEPPSKYKYYNNDKVYADYAPTPLLKPHNVNKAFAQVNIKTYYKQYNDSIKIIATTTKPLTFFYRYDFAIKRMIGIIYMQKYVKVTGDSPARIAEKAIDGKQDLVKQLIDRCANDYDIKISKLKTVSSKAKKINSFEAQFEPFMDEISNDNKDYIRSIAENFRRIHLCD